MEYIDTKTLYKEVEALYCRVSTAGQTISMQVAAAEIYFKQHNINTEKVKNYIDHNVSANKRSARNRPEFQNLIIDIKKGRIKTLYVLSRDRLARNFYEYVDLVQTLYLYEVNVVFTDFNQPPFSQELSLEALYGIFPQFNGRNIASRTNLSSKQYPNSLLGFKVLDQRNRKKYIPDPDTENDLRTFFYSIMNVCSSEDLFDNLIKFKRLFKNHHKQLNCLANPFYAGHTLIQEQYVPLDYVEPLISLDEFIKIQDILSHCQQELHKAMNLSSDVGLLTPICSLCKEPMSFRSGKLKENSYYVCSKRHSRIKLSVNQFNQQISEHLTDILNQISLSEIENDVCLFLNKAKTKYNQQMDFSQNKLEAIHRQITELYGIASTNTLEKLGRQTQLIKEEMNQVKTNLIKIEEANEGINQFITVVKESINDGLRNYQMDYLVPLLFSKIEVSNNAIFYHVNFGKYVKRKDDLNAS
jgi:site-specific DNA recombinase